MKLSCLWRDTLKKHLLTTAAALMVTSGYAAAQDISWSGYARYGFTYNDIQEDVMEASRFRLTFNASVNPTSDLELGTSARLQIEENAANGFNQANFYVQTGNLRVTMGNICGVIECAPGLYLPTKSAGVGLEGNGFAGHPLTFASGPGTFAWTYYSSGGVLQGGAGGQATRGIEVTYNMGDFGVHAHHTVEGYAIGGSYSMNDLTFAAGTEQYDSNDGMPGNDGDELWYASAAYATDLYNVGLAYGYGEDGTTGQDASKWSLRGGYNVTGATEVYGFVATENNGIGESFGLGVSHDLGAGASIEAGWTYQDDIDGTNTSMNTVSAGLHFGF